MPEMVRTVCHPGFPQCNDVAMSGETQTRGPKDTDTANNQYNCRLLVFSCLLAQYNTVPAVLQLLCQMFPQPVSTG